MNYLIVIPARGGSKGIPGKNIYPIKGKPLLEYTLDLFSESKPENFTIAVSTDSSKIKSVAEKYDFVYVIDRPEEISGDTASTESALLHSVDVMHEKYDMTFDAVITLQATSPLRQIATLQRIVEQYEKDYPTYDAILSLNENRADFWKKTDSGNFERLYKNAPRRRQDREPLYVENSAYYITDLNALRKTNSVLGTSVNGFVIDADEAVDINDMIDIMIVESILDKNKG